MDDTTSFVNLIYFLVGFLLLIAFVPDFVRNLKAKRVYKNVVNNIENVDAILFATYHHHLKMEGNEHDDGTILVHTVDVLVDGKQSIIILDADKSDFIGAMAKFNFLRAEKGLAPLSYNEEKERAVAPEANITWNDDYKKDTVIG